MERRELFKIIAVSAATAGAASAQHAGHATTTSASSPAPTFFSEKERRLLSAVCGLILPADEEGGGALEAGVPRYIETVVFYSDAAAKASFQAGLSAVDRTATEMTGKGLLDLPQQEQERVILAIAKNERTPATDLDRFFVRLKDMTILSFFQSAVGMKYVGYKGDTAISTFPGCTHPEHLATPAD